MHFCNYRQGVYGIITSTVENVGGLLSDKLLPFASTKYPGASVIWIADVSPHRLQLMRSSTASFQIGWHHHLFLTQVPGSQIGAVFSALMDEVDVPSELLVGLRFIISFHRHLL